MRDTRSDTKAMPIPAAAQQYASFVTHEGAEFWLENSESTECLTVMAPLDHPALERLNGIMDKVDDRVFVRGELSAENAAALQGRS